MRARDTTLGTCRVFPGVSNGRKKRKAYAVIRWYEDSGTGAHLYSHLRFDRPLPTGYGRKHERVNQVDNPHVEVDAQSRLNCRLPGAGCRNRYKYPGGSVLVIVMPGNFNDTVADRSWSLVAWKAKAQASQKSTTR